MTTLCYWIVGRDTDWPAVAIDLHDSDGNLIGETHTARDSDPHAYAAAYAAERGITNVHFDRDSTDFYAAD